MISIRKTPGLDSWRRPPLVLLAVLAASAVGPIAGAAAGDADPPEFRLLDRDGKSSKGLLKSLTPSEVVLNVPEATTFDVGRIVRLERNSKPPVPSENLPAVLLANGDRLMMRVESVTEDALDASWPLMGGPVFVPLETIRGIVVTSPESSDRRWTLEGLLTARRDDSDLVLLARGDRMTGEIVGWKKDSLSLKGPTGDVALERAQIQALGFSAALTSFPPLNGPRQLVELSDGSQLVMKDGSLTDGQYSGKAAFGGGVSFKIEDVVSVRFFGGRVQPLSELPTDSFQHTPYVSGQWSLSLDRTVQGRPLRLRGITFPRGLGMHSRSSVTYALDEKFESFLSTAGVDDETRGRGNVVFAVAVDGKPVFTSPPQSGDAAPLAIGPIDLKGARTLTLLVDFGELGDVQDHADWCDPVLIRRP